MKVASAIVCKTLIDIGSSVDIITWDCLRKLKHSRRETVPLVHPILGFGGQEVNPMGMICLPLCFGDKAKARNLEVHLACNAILGGPILGKVKAVTALYLLQLQFEVDNGSISKLQGGQRTTRKCYLVSIQPSIKWSAGYGPARPPPSDKRPQTVPPNPAEALVIHTLALAEPEQPQLETIDGLKRSPWKESILSERFGWAERWRSLPDTHWWNSYRCIGMSLPSTLRKCLASTLE